MDLNSPLDTEFDYHLQMQFSIHRKKLAWMDRDQLHF